MDYYFIISLIHVFITGPLLIYIGLTKPLNIIYYYALLLLALIIIIAFIYRLFKKQLYAWLYVHLLLFVTLLLSIFYLKITDQKIPYYLYSFLVAIGIAAVGYHLIKIFKVKK
jgi:hypothetical protein